MICSRLRNPDPPTPREHDAQGFRDHGDHDHITAAAPFSVLDWELDRWYHTYKCGSIQ